MLLMRIDVGNVPTASTDCTAQTYNCDLNCTQSAIWMDGASVIQIKISAENVDLGFSILFFCCNFRFSSCNDGFLLPSVVSSITAFSIKDFPQFLKCVICSAVLMMMMMQYCRTSIDNILILSDVEYVGVW